MTNHPLGDELYAAHASGALSGPMGLLLDAQACVNPDVARQRAAAEAVSGVMLETVAPVAVRDNALSQVLAAIDAEEAGLGEAALTPGFSDQAARRAAQAAGKGLNEILGLPAPVRDLALDRGASWQFAGPGVRTMTLMEDGGAKAELIRLEPGRGVPRHGHDGREFTLVLNGAFHDGIDRYGTGELCAADPGTEHKPVAEPGAVCIALAVTDGPLAFTGPLGWVQRALGG
ncbi:MAG: ChrR family anti-sigma-E factor [Oceanicaulis sp.]|nr:ChrR family anti-sigma-E factor [Oceanicaulis sp.]